MVTGVVTGTPVQPRPPAPTVLFSLFWFVCWFGTFGMKIPTETKVSGFSL